MNWSQENDSQHEKQKKIRKKAAKLRTRERREGGDPKPLHVWERRVQESNGADTLIGFHCRNCGLLVSWEGGGTEHRNHCPSCLHSVHLDIEPGDRSADCGGLMEPISVWVRRKGEWAVVHRCKDCGALSSNRIAADDNEALLVSLAMRPIAMPPFPLDRTSTTIEE